MTQDKPHTSKLELSPAQIVGSALAAMSAAFFASWAGTAGTLAGAALGSLFATAGAAVYTWWLRRTSAVVRRTAVTVRETGMGSTVVVPGLRTRSTGDSAEATETPAKTSDGAKGEEPVDESHPDEPQSDDQPDGSQPDRWAFLRNRPWGKVVLVAAGVMLAALASITIVEAVTGKPLSSFLNGDDGTGTTVGRVVGRDDAPAQQEPEDEVTPSPSRAPEESSTPTPSTPTPTQLTTPSVEPTPSPSVQVPTPVETPEGGQAPEEGTTPAP